MFIFRITALYVDLFVTDLRVRSMTGVYTDMDLIRKTGGWNCEVSTSCRTCDGMIIFTKTRETKSQ
jgi:hypothetical protein